MPAASELERAGNPEIACVKADDLVPGVKDAAVARPRAPERDRLDVTRWRYAIPCGHRTFKRARIAINGHRVSAPMNPT
jgi:hypothetical protein